MVYHQVIKDDADLIRGTLLDLVANSALAVTTIDAVTS